MGKVMMMVYQLMLLLLLQWNNYLARLKGLAKKKLNRLPPLFFSLFLLQAVSAALLKAATKDSQQLA